MFYQFSTEVLFPIVILIVAFGMGLSLTVKSFFNVVKSPKRVLVGLFGQLVFLPLIVIIFVTTLNLPAAIAMGLILIAACPGGTSSNAIVFAIKGEVALSVTLTSFTSLLMLLTLPFWVGFGIDRYANEKVAVLISSIDIIKKLFLYMLLPIIVGMIVKHILPILAEKIEAVFRSLTLVLFLMIIGVSVYNVRGSISELWLPVGIASIVLSLILQLSAYFLPKFLKLPRRDRLTYAVEIGVQNTVLAIFIGSSILHWDELGVVAIIYGLVNYALIAGFIWVSSRVKNDVPPKQLS